MKKLLLLPLLVSLSGCLPEDSNKVYYEPPVCLANGDPQPATAGSSQLPFNAPASYKTISVSFTPSDFGMSTFSQQVRVTLNGAVVYNSCRPVDIDGITLQNSSSSMYFRLDLDQNQTWRDEYFHNDGTPKKWALEMQIDGKRNCGGERWQPVLPSTAALLNWQESSGPCSYGDGYSAYITYPIPLDEPWQTSVNDQLSDQLSDPQ